MSFGRQTYETNKAFFALADSIYHFTHDLAADHTNAKCKNYFSLPYNDALLLPWAGLDGYLWLNPPFSQNKDWVKKAHGEWKKGAKICVLTLASVGSNWFRDYVWNRASVRFLNGRMKFEGQTTPFDKDLMLIIFDDQPVVNDLWLWKDDLKKEGIVV